MHMFIKLTKSPTLIPIPSPDRHERKSLISNHPNRDAIAFLIDTLAIRNDPNPFNNNLICLSNRYKTGLFYVPHHGAIRQSAFDVSLSSVELPAVRRSPLSFWRAKEEVSSVQNSN